MTHTKAKLLGAGLVIGVAATLLAISGMREGWVYFLPVDQFMESAGRHDQRVRLHGKVADQNFHSDRTALAASFDLLGKTKSIRVNYTGVIPDMFDAGRDVVVE